ncbi:1,4-dihydroxy-2-naphthoate octaprenyltransferase [Sediminihabitans luteus]|uniref:1,4-dihydroxy-2-naphthoate octaprenyltransferase n=1 Tax=Sediminihabitans luteus TaxID=1138585 RepID=A0A2M9D0Y2_9CELL|nr:UbiA family prenyltransferase [Sediminihabitans luteus]PJJ77856.1 1,4-dihydroxy-2-naphthoate octaprenyltransferase [Sediminihabitans luteus]GII99786.1 membrane protein [Sediminihabitans luteus]
MVPMGVRVRGLVVASHAGPTAVVTLLTLSLATGIEAGTLTTVLVTAAVLCGQLSVGWSNDWLDAARDARVGRSDKPTVVGVVGASELRTAAFVALAACVVLSYANGWVAGTLHVLAVASAWSYNVRLKSTVLSWLPYAVSFGLLPAFIVAAPDDGRVVAAWTVAAAALLGVGAHLANVLPDIEDDAATGVRGLPHRLGRRRVAVLAPLVLLAASVVILVGPSSSPGLPRIAFASLTVVMAVAAGVVGARWPRSRLPFGLSMGVAALCVVELVIVAPSVALPG